MKAKLTHVSDRPAVSVTCVQLMSAAGGWYVAIDTREKYPAVELYCNAGSGEDVYFEVLFMQGRLLTSVQIRPTTKREKAVFPTAWGAVISKRYGCHFLIVPKPTPKQEQQARLLYEV